MASGNIEVTIGFDKKSLKKLRKFAKKLQECADTLAEVREKMDKLALKRMPKEGRPYICGSTLTDAKGKK